MSDYMQIFKSDLKRTLTNKRFWQIQWLNLLYFIKYVNKYTLFILTYSLTMSYLYVELLNSSDGAFTHEQGKVIVSACVVLFITVRYLRVLWSAISLVIPQSGQLLRSKRRNDFLRQLIFVLLVISSDFLNTETIFQHITIESIPTETVIRGGSAVFCYVTMIFCIRSFWKKLNNQMLLLGITSNEPLNTDVCSGKVHFSNGWNDFVRVVETGINYKRNLKKDLFYVSPSEYAECSETALESNVAVSLRFSMATGQLKRLILPMVTVNPHIAVTGAPGKPKKGGAENVKTTIN